MLPVNEENKDRRVQMNFLRASWDRALNRSGAQTDSNKLFDQLIACYLEPHRKYHTLQHLTECIESFEKAQQLAEHLEEVEIALWFHDAIYNTKRNDNEEQSANWAGQALTASLWDEESVARVTDLVRVTQHTGLPVTSDQQLLLDIDLSILGAAENRFAEYEQQIRAEYAFVPGWIFRRKRRAILQKFLDRPRIYNTTYFYTSLEQQARENLRHAIN